MITRTQCSGVYIYVYKSLARALKAQLLAEALVAMLLAEALVALAADGATGSAFSYSHS